jgi:uncharacterized delta-60 repeat protein
VARRGRLPGGIFLTILLVAGVATVLRAVAEGDVDVRYGTDGFALVSYGQNGTKVAASARQPDGKMVVVGGVITKTIETPDLISFEYGAVAMRFTADGALDASFGPGGIVAFGLGSAQYDHVSGLALDYSQDPANPRIVICGVSMRGPYSKKVFVAARLTPDGSLDTTFGTGGLAAIDFVTDSTSSYSEAYAYAVAVQPDGKVLLGGTAKDDTADPNSARSGFGLAVARLNEDGSPDASFEPVHQFLDEGPSAVAYVSALALDADGSVVAVGARADMYVAGRPFLIRVEPQGGEPTMSQDLAMVEAAAVRIVPRAPGEQGDIVVAGSLKVGTFFDQRLAFAVERRHPDGTPDVDFGMDGLAWVNLGGRYNTVRALDVDWEGKIVLVGPVGAYGPDDLGVARLLPSGQPDTDFGALVAGSYPPRRSGFTKIDLSISDSAAGVALDGGRIVVAGNFSDETYFGGVVLTRLIGVAPVIAPAFGRAPEGDIGETEGTLEVTLSKPGTETITVDYETYVVSGWWVPQATPGQDYVAASGTLTFAPGETSKAIRITLLGDTLYEGLELVAIRLTNPTGPASLAAADTTFGIEEDDPLPMVTIDDVAVAEGHSGPTAVRVPVRMSAPCSMETMFAFVTIDATATVADDDYVSIYDHGRIPAGQTETALTVIVNGDARPEPDEEFKVKLIPSGGGDWCGAGYGKATATITILDDDTKAATTTALVSSPNPSVVGQSVTLTATVSAVSPASGIPSGAITFWNTTAGTTLGTGAVNASGVATFATTTLAVGTHDLGAVYGGDSQFFSSAGSRTHVVNEAGTAFYFSGFFSPVANQPRINDVRAGSAVPVKFSLGGDRGLNVLAPGFPASQRAPCDSLAPTASAEPTRSAGGSGLSYDASSTVYSYVWKTEKAWAGQCRLLIVTLTDGSTHTARFRFR